MPPKSRKKAANGYKLAEPLPKGEILEDVAKKKWKLGPSIGQGGFGEIYSAQEAVSRETKYPYVIKIEPHDNGPLFVEMHFYIKCAKQEDVEAFKNQKDLKTLGMPIYLGSGSHEFNGQKYRFVVMEKYGIDLWKIFLEHEKHFPATTVFKIAIQILDVLEYIHSKGYVHADIKGANILMGTTKETESKQVYLIDFGLAVKCNEDVEFKPNPKKAHDGTIEYLSRDAHNGVQTRRGDLEALGYNLIQWLGCVLPWEKKINDPNKVHKSKEEHMSSIFQFIKACFNKRSPPGAIVDFLNYLSTLNHNSIPDYKNIRKIFLSGLDSGDAIGKPLQFKAPEKSPTKRKNEEVLKSSPKKKLAKRQVEKEESVNEEDVANGSGKDGISKNINKRGTNKTKEPKAKKKTANKKKTAAQATDESPKVISEDKDIETEDLEEKLETDASEGKTHNDNKKNLTKGAKKFFEEENNGIDNEEPVPVVSVRTRGRGRVVNYKEDSDNEKKSSRRKVNNPTTSKDMHVTGDSPDENTETTKKVQKPRKIVTKITTEVDEESAVTSTSEELPKKGRKKRVAKKTEENV